MLLLWLAAPWDVAVLARRLEKPGTLVSRSDSLQLHSGYVILEPGKEVGEHATEGGEELIVMVEGKAEVTSQGHAVTVEAPCVVLVPAHTVHNVKNRSEAPLKYVYIVVATDRPADN
jgi:quercetin dioxygenase-like cupin family protein